MSGWLAVPHPDGDPERVHVVPAIDDEPDPMHDPSPDCACKPRMTTVMDLLGKRHQIVVHHGPN